MNHSIWFVLCFLASSAVLQAQDTLLFEGKWPYLVHIVKESESKVFYKKLNSRDTSLYYVEKRFVTSTGYKDPEDRQRRFRPDQKATRPLELWVTTSDTSSVVKGFLHSLNDTVLYLNRQKGWLKRDQGTDLIYILPYHGISKIQVVRRRQVRQYALIGAGAGFIAGFLTGQAIFKDAPPCETGVVGGRPCDKSLFSPQTRMEKSLLLGIGAAGTGFLAGGFYGLSVKVRIPIHGKRDIFSNAVPRLERMARIEGQEEQPLLKSGKKNRKDRR